MLRLRPLQVRWTPLNLNNTVTEQKVSARLADVLRSWEDTPYSATHANKGVGVYCTAFVCGVLDELFRRPEPTPLNKIPHDVSMHSPSHARAGLRWFMRHFPSAERIWSVTQASAGVFEEIHVQPGDVLITGPIGGGPGHAIMIGPRKNVMWQASGRAVHYTGLYIPSSELLYAIYRFTDKESWA